MKNLTEEQKKTFELAMGRIFRLGARAFQPGDVEEYERCRSIIMEISDDAKGGN
jgi:hypothetical protein